MGHPSGSVELSVLLTEYERVYTEIMDMQRKSDTIAGLGVTGIGAILVVGLPQETPGMLAIATLFATVLVLYITLCYCVIMSLGGYKDYLEITINDFAKIELLKWERLITKPYLHEVLEMKCLFGVLYLLPLVMFVFSQFLDRISIGILNWIYTVLFLAVYLACWKAAFRLLKLPEAVREAASQGFAQEK